MPFGTGALLLAAATGGGAAGGTLAFLAEAAADPAGLGVGDFVQGGSTMTAIGVGIAFFRSTHARALARVDALETRLDELTKDSAGHAREVTRADAAEQRADRLERKLDELTHTMIERVAPVLADATRTLVDATAVIRSRP